MKAREGDFHGELSGISVTFSLRKGIDGGLKNQKFEVPLSLYVDYS